MILNLNADQGLQFLFKSVGCSSRFGSWTSIDRWPRPPTAGARGRQDVSVSSRQRKSPGNKQRLLANEKANRHSLTHSSPSTQLTAQLASGHWRD